MAPALDPGECERASAAAGPAAAASHDFLTAASHDLRNPLTTVRGAVQGLARRLARGDALYPPDLRAALGAIDAATRRMEVQIDALLEVARLRPGRPLELRRQQTDLVALVRSAVSEYRAATDRHRLRVETTLGALVGRWDHARLDRVLGNLLDNAIKYSPEGGEVAVGVRRDDGPGGAWAVVTVADAGIGIPEESLTLVFERFERGANAAGRIPGAGVGQYGARQIVEQHGGTIGVRSREGGGSTFTVRLPLEHSNGATEVLAE